MSDIRKKINESVSKRLKEEQKIAEFVFEGIDPDDVKPLREFFKEHGDDYSWDESLEDALYDKEDLHESTKEGIVYKVGDIIMTTRYESQGKYIEDSPHRVLIITSKEDADGVVNYKGFILSSKVHKSNKAGKYPNNIYINDYSTILYRGKSYNKEAIIRVDDIVSFTSEDLSDSGTWKGSANYEFINFVQKCYDNYKRGISNADIYWEK